jgi:hypothetical protein
VLPLSPMLLVLLALLVSPVLPLQAHSREPLAQRRLAQPAVPAAYRAAE